MTAVDAPELAFFAVAIVVLVGVAGFFAWRQLRTLRALRAGPDLGPEDRLYLRSQAYRRLVGSALLVGLAGLLAGYFFWEGPLQEVRHERREQVARDRSAPVQPEHKRFLQEFTAYSIVLLLVLLLLLALVVVDLRAIARFGQRHRRQLREDLRATLATELARLRKRGNGRN
jgi:hypothetical protein